jgi:carbon-monoxide dehydrogenase medium subunit
VIPATFEYIRPSSIDEALAALADPDAKAIAGGHSLVPMMKLRLARPSVLVDLTPLGLRGVTRDGDVLHIGALTTYDDLVRSDAPVPDALREAAAAVGDVQVRNAGTIGGAVAHGDPASDLMAAVLALDTVIGLRSADGTRQAAATDFVLGPFETALGQQELLEEIVVPVHGSGDGSAYYSFEDDASGYPLAGAAVRVHAGGVSVGLTGATPTPVRAPSIEAVLAGGDPGEAAVLAAVAQVELSAGADDPDFTRSLVTAAVRRAFASAHARARGAT